MKPILLLDVDGVLNIVGPDYHERIVKLPGDGHSFYPTPFVRPFMKWAWRTFDVVWNTAWRDSANDIAEWVGLSRIRVIKETAVYLRKQERKQERLVSKRMDVPSLSWFRDQGDWKAAGAKALVGSDRRLVFWIEDGISLEAQAWVRARPHTYPGLGARATAHVLHGD